MASLADLLRCAHPNSALRRRFPNGCTTAQLPNWRADRFDTDARTLTGQPEDYERPVVVVDLFDGDARHRGTEYAGWRDSLAA